MGKRNVRIAGKEIAGRIAELEGKQVQLITLSGLTFAGKFENSGPDAVKILDPGAFWYNRKKHTHLLKLNEILEVIFDKVTDY